MNPVVSRMKKIASEDGEKVCTTKKYLCDHFFLLKHFDFERNEVGNFERRIKAYFLSIVRKNCCRKNCGKIYTVEKTTCLKIESNSVN